MANYKINFWDTELEYHFYPSGTQLDFTSFLQLDWDEKLRANDTKVVFDFLWSMRLSLWPSLIESNLLEVRFLHDGLTGNGSGPYLFFQDTSHIKNLPTDELLKMSIGTLLASDYFSDSDRFLADIDDETGFLGLPTLQIEFLKYEEMEFDREDIEVFFEHTFSADYRITSIKMPKKAWHQNSEEVQLLALNSLTNLADAQRKAYDELIQDLSDILVCIALYPKSAKSIQQLSIDYLEKSGINLLLG